jgi:hypothetical protein
VPQEVADYTAGGFALIRKYLCYRVGDTLTQDDIRIVTEFCRRIARLIELQAEADQLADAAEQSPLVPITQANPQTP